MMPSTGQFAGKFVPSLLSQTMFAALRYRNYRLWFTGQLVSLIGSWMQITAQGFLIFELTHSTTYLGYVGFAMGLPAWLFMLFGGVIADRVQRRSLLLITQTTMMILAVILAALTFLHWVQPWQIVWLAFGLGIANAFDAPARQAFVLEMVGREDLTNAIALNSTMFNLATVIGPASGGVIYAWVGPAWCFTINAMTFVAVIAALAMMRIEPLLRSQRTTAAFDDFKAGLHYVASHTVIRALLCLIAVMSLFGTAYVTLMPAWAVRILGGDATTNGWLLSARGVGAVGGALMIAALGRFRFKGKLLTFGSLLFHFMLLSFALVRWLPLSLFALVLVGWGYLTTFNLTNTLIQTLVSDEFRGRVISLFTMGFFALQPLCALLSGWTAEVIGTPKTIILGALISLSFVVGVFFKVPQIRAQP